MRLVMAGVVVLIVVAVATDRRGDSEDQLPGRPAIVTRPAVSAATVAYDLELMAGADEARCSWVTGTQNEFSCAVRIGRARAETRVYKPLDMTETIGIRRCARLNPQHAKEGGLGEGNACPALVGARSKP
jgi:hypothetical protein